MSEILGGGGVRIAVRTAGQADAPAIVFVHGWAQSSRVWRTQLDSAALAGFRLVAMDLRGHGRSEVPDAGYDDPRSWADDLAGVLDYAGTPAVVVGWSYGGLVIADYLRTYGGRGIAGLVLAGAITEIGKRRPGGAVGPVMRDALPDAMAEDPAAAIPAVANLGAGMSMSELPGAFAQELVGAILSVPPAVRGALFRRDVDNSDVLESVSIPTLVLHGTEDTVVDPAAGEYAAGKIPGAVLRWMPGVGHMPFIERADEFDSMLRQFAEQHLPATARE